MEKHAFIFIGRSGSGKGTQLELLRKKCVEKFPKKDINVLFIGDQLRHIAEGSSYTGQLANSVLDKGDLFPEMLSVWAAGDEFIQEMKPDQTIFIDGFARTVMQAQILDSAMRFYNYTSLFIINLEISAAESANRLRSRARADDTEAAIERRAVWYGKKTVPAIDYFRNKVGYTVLDINGERSREEIHDEIWKELKLA